MESRRLKRNSTTGIGRHDQQRVASAEPRVRVGDKTFTADTGQISGTQPPTVEASRPQRRESFRKDAQKIGETDFVGVNLNRYAAGAGTPAWNIHQFDGYFHGEL